MLSVAWPDLPTPWTTRLPITPRRSGLTRSLQMPTHSGFTSVLCHCCAQTSEIAIDKVMRSSLPNHVALGVDFEPANVHKDSTPAWDRQAITHARIGKSY